MSRAVHAQVGHRRMGGVGFGFGLGGWWFMALALGLISQPLGHLSPGPAKANLVPAGCIKIDTLTH